MEKKLKEAKQTMQQRKHNKKLYVRSWRVTEKVRRQTNSFVTDYVKQKFYTVYSEALCLYHALEKQYPGKYDLRKTKEYRQWKEGVNGTSDHGLAGTVQTLITQTTLNEGYQNRKGIIRCTTETVLENGDQGSSSSSNNNSEQSDTGCIDQQNYHDNLVLEIPLQTYSTPSDHNLGEIPPQPEQAPPVDEIPPQLQAPPVDESITDERIREIIEELRNDPDLNNLFNDPQPEIAEQDEGVELPSLEEEIELDFEPFDYHIEVEQENW